MTPAGLDAEKIEYMLELRASGNDIVAPYADKFAGSTFYAGKKPWEQKVDIALPCATQNELGGEDAKQLIANGVTLCAEVSNMGCTLRLSTRSSQLRFPMLPARQLTQVV